MASYHPYSFPPEHQMFLAQQQNRLRESISPPGSDHTQMPIPHASSSNIGKWTGPTNGNASGQKSAPVKAACLSCRNKKAKCDGKQPVCGQCARKNLECVFVKSRRGGARKRRPVVAPTALSEFLKKLDTLLTSPALDHESKALDDVKVDPNEDTTNVVKQFNSREEIFERYYKDVHPYVTVMPPRTLLQTILPTLLPESPFLLSVQTILVLAPHANDSAPNSSRSKKLRQLASESFAEQTIRLVDSMISNGQLNLECVQATCIIALWEWSSLGSVTKNKERSIKAIQLAMELGLHELDKYSSTSISVDPNENGRTIEGLDWKKDMARRTWWTTYTSQLTAALVSGNQPIVGPDDPRILVDYPICSVTDHSWANFIETVKSTIRVFNLVTSVYFPQLPQPPSIVQNEDDNDNSNTSAGFFSASDNENKQITAEIGIRNKMVDVDKQIMDLIKKAEDTAVIELVPGGEEEVGRNQQLQARLGLAVVHIHIHRWQAFPEVSLFSRKICGLPQAPDFVINDDAQEGSELYGNEDLNSMETDTPPEYHYDQQQGQQQQIQYQQNQIPHDPSSVNQQVNYHDINYPNASAPVQQQMYDPNQGYYNQASSSTNAYPAEMGQHNGQNQHSQQQNGEWGGQVYNDSNHNEQIYEYGMMEDMWAPETYPDNLPAPWFSYPGGAANLYVPTYTPPNHYPEITASIQPIQPSPPASSTHQRSSVPPSEDGGINNTSRRASGGSSVISNNKPHKAWGVDDKSDKVLPPPELQKLEVFPPGISLARCATAAHTIVRLEVLHRSAVIAMWDGPPKWPPFCSCGLVTGAYAFLLLALAVQAENSFSGYTNSRSEEVEALLTNVKVILAGLEAYGTMWAGIDSMAGEVRAALEAATRLPFEVSAQIENGTASPSTQGGMQD
ncbi:uncharacterized protein L201_002083 [Kwoniella dendrophila CBS 6074]|uniref:Zn(2)-C6 fungal-type domain-containing protein n=1 Tax=Kwoniella dendrophila CBS 6074 TaxID=1295534 RepID=A0AAX4JPA5_9TREE